MKYLILTAPPALLTTCTLGPNHIWPIIEKNPTAFKEIGDWKMAQPRDQEIRGKWWGAYNDAQLNALEEQEVSISNQKD